MATSPLQSMSSGMPPPPNRQMPGMRSEMTPALVRPPSAPTTAPGRPLVRLLGLQQLQERDRQNLPEVESILNAESESSLASHVRQAWERNKLAKDKVSRRLLACLRARKGVYSADEIALKQAAGAQNIVWYDLTETKCKAASAWIREVVLPAAGELPWGCDPSSIPDLPVPFKESIVAKAIKEAMDVVEQAARSGGGMMPTDEFRQTVREIGERLRNDAEEEFKKRAALRAKRMQRVIEDRFDEGGWADAMDAFVEDFVTYPTAFVKGPVYQRRPSLSWTAGWEPKVSRDPKQTYHSVSPFDIYPQAGVGSLQQGDLVEHERLFRSELYDCKGLPGYQDDQIDEALMDYSAGRLENWLWTESERQRLEGESLHAWLTPHGMIDVVNYWGAVPGWKLKEWGIRGADQLEDTRDYECNIRLVGRYVIFAALNPHPLNKRPYGCASYDAIPGGIWGRAIPELVDTAQKMCNTICCAIADNTAMSSGPMVWVYIDQLAPGENIDLIPWKVWQLNSKPGQTAGNPGIGFFQAEDRSAAHMQNLEKWEIKADDVSGVPRYTYGNERVGGAGNTASGLSMLLNNAAKGLRRAISAIDMGVTQPIVYWTFVNEMLYNPDESIKGDCIVVPKGASAILIKDAAQTRRQTFLGMTANPVDMAIIGNRGRATLLRETAVAMELPADQIVPTDEELIKREKEQAEAAQAQAQAQAEAQQQQESAKLQGQMALEDHRADSQQRLRANEQMDGIVGDLIRGAVASGQRFGPGAGTGGGTRSVRAAGEPNTGLAAALQGDRLAEVI